MAKLNIRKRGHYWALLEVRLGIDAFATKQEAYEELAYMKRCDSAGVAILNERSSPHHLYELALC